MTGAGSPIRQLGIAMDLVDLSEIARRAKTTRGMIRSWRARGIGFPLPVVVLAIGPVWSWGDVKRWLDQPRQPGRPGRSQAAAAPVPGRHL